MDLIRVLSSRGGKRIVLKIEDNLKRYLKVDGLLPLLGRTWYYKWRSSKGDIDIYALGSKKCRGQSLHFYGIALVRL